MGKLKSLNKSYPNFDATLSLEELEERLEMDRIGGGVTPLACICKSQWPCSVHCGICVCITHCFFEV